MAQQRKLHDKYFKLAKREGYLARSAYKLLEIQKRRKLISRGDRVLDLGCAPGSWLQVAEKLVGADGVVVGIDLQRVDHDFGDNVFVTKGDFTTTDARALLAPIVGEGSDPRFDVVISDMAPSTTGHGDHFMSEQLCQKIVDALPELLRSGGNCTMKVLEGESFPDLLKRVKHVFRSAGAIKPDACRDVSRETYIYGLGFRPTRVREQEARSDTAPAMPAPKRGWGS